MTKRFLFLLFLILVFLTGCLIKPSEDGGKTSEYAITPTLHETKDKGMICFEKADQPNSIKGYYAYGCFGGCSSIRRSSLVATANTSQRTIKFSTDVVVVDEGDPEQTPSICPTVCVGVLLHFDIGRLEAGEYVVWLGEQAMGTLNVPGEPVCFGEQY
jgi:hypothetical protein